ncbi:uncharacterized protein LOC113283368 [Papaver somniferum]|uniref:uncharacterized protein LOC113283368 n=1 Tax=Papaver somniferum TaxID=3469 RepID=UPI000E6F5F32|nr:uncharacterized protein LOC113283368 [Papaver somniferum]
MPSEEVKKRFSIESESSSIENPTKITKTVEVEEEEEDIQFSDEEEEEEEEELQKPQIINNNPRMQRYLVAFEYHGGKFFGSQQQAVRRTVIGALQEAFRRFIGQPVKIISSSRTDAGVHALSNVCHVDVERISKRRPGEVLPPYEPEVVRNAVNHYLLKYEGDVAVVDVRCIPADFHARHRALERTYFYRILSGPEPLSTFERGRAWHVEEELDIVAIQKACRVLVGDHDFSSFRGTGCQAKSPIKTLTELSVTEVASTPYFPSKVERDQANPMEQDPIVSSSTSGIDVTCKVSVSIKDKLGGFDAAFGEEFGRRKVHRCYVITARARSFLYHQVRLLVGVLKAAGTGEITTSDVERILNAKTVTATSATAPAYGLYLGRVKYKLP